AGEGADRLGPAAPRRRDQVQPGGRAVHRRGNGARRAAGAAGGARAAPRWPAQSFRHHAARRRRRARGRRRVVRVRAEGAHRDRRAAGERREEIDARIAELLAVVDLEETIFELGLRGAADTRKNSTLAERVLAARARLRERLASLGIQDWVERFDPNKYNRNATLAENL